MYLLTKYIKSVLWGVTIRLSYIWDVWCLKVKEFAELLLQHIDTKRYLHPIITEQSTLLYERRSCTELRLICAVAGDWYKRALHPRSCIYSHSSVSFTKDRNSGVNMDNHESLIFRTSRVTNFESAVYVHVLCTECRTASPHTRR